jgi:hypothetical protein
MAREQLWRAAGGILRKRLIALIYTQNWKRSSISSFRINDKLFQTTEGTVRKCEMDTHAENCVAGSNFFVSEFDGTTCEVTPFMDQYQLMKGVLDSRVPTKWEMQNCCIIVVTDDYSWDPANIRVLLVFLFP